MLSRSAILRNEVSLWLYVDAVSALAVLYLPWHMSAALTGHHFANLTNHFETVSTFLVHFQSLLIMYELSKRRKSGFTPRSLLPSENLQRVWILDLCILFQPDFVFSPFNFPLRLARLSFFNVDLKEPLFVPQIHKLGDQRERWLALCQRCWPNRLLSPQRFLFHQRLLERAPPA